MAKSAEGDGGNSSHIRTFLRIRPSKRPSGYITVDEHDKTRLNFHVPVETKDGEVSVDFSRVRETRRSKLLRVETAELHRDVSVTEC